MRRKMGLISVLTLLGLGGCLTPSLPPAEAVIEGTWELTGAVVPDEVSNFFVTFNSRGQIIRLQYRVNTTRITLDDPDFIQTDSTVTGSDVSIVASWFSLNNLVFSGTLNDALTQIDGTASYELVVGSVTIEAPFGDATLTKQ